ncbi:MAG: SLBB domain-containing protein [Bacteroidaceae bacterium]|nr:SLBB domain-containing protein [Bacteroidaceae bacterium]
MKKTLLFFIISLIGIIAHAQTSMTDDQIKTYVIEEYQNGTSEQEIVTQLLKRGATIQQIKKVRTDLEKQRKALSQNEKNNAKSNDVRLRTPHVPNDNSKKDNKSESLKKSKNDYWTPNNELDVDFENLNLEEEPKDSIQIFGRNIFANKALTFESEINIPIPADYEIGVGDVVIIDIWGASQKTITHTVSPQGEIVVDGYGPINLTGLTVDAANKRVKSTLGKIYDNSDIKLTIGQTKTITVNIMGEVENPGSYTISAFSTVFHALYQAGGTTTLGTLRNIKVYRKNKLISTVDIYDYLLNGNLNGNVRLQSDDVIIVGTYDNLVKVAGMIKRPMCYEMKANESVDDLLKYAGGFTENAFIERIRLTRKERGHLSVYTLDETQRSKFHLINGDSLTIDSVLNRYNNMVEIRGAIKQPGKYQMDGSIKTIKQLIEVAGGVTEDALLNRALLHRRKTDRTIEVMSVDLNQLLAGEIADIQIQNEDELYIHSRTAELNEYELYIYGEVVNPGYYSYADNMTIEDLIITAGGLLDAASLTRIDVARRIRDKETEKSNEIVSHTFTFSIKDGLLIEKDKKAFTLQPYDEVYVRRAPNYIMQEHVQIKGEATFAGTYTISKRNYRLSDLIKAAGGLSSGAYVMGARLERRLTDEELVLQREMLKVLNDSIDKDKLDLKTTKYVGINLEKAMQNPGDDFYDLVLQDGDVLNIPQINNTITISGEVLYPNTIVYQDNKKLSYYINQAGGYTDKAKKNKVYAVNMDGTVTIVKKAKDIKPGARIVVPTKEEREKLNFTQYISIFSTIAMMGSVIATLLK